MNRLFQTFILLAALHGPRVDSRPFFTPHLQIGETIGNIFSRTISYKSDSFPEVCFRVSGTAIYTVKDSSSWKPVLTCAYRYDARGEGVSTVHMSDFGKTATDDSGRSAVNTDASGFLFNQLIWGTAPATLAVGDTWTVRIPQAWELGGPGDQTVTVMDIDPQSNTIRLKREGRGEGFYDNDAKSVTIQKNGKPVRMTITPGVTHWVGYTTFKNGLVISDELLSTRTVTLTDNGVQYQASQREYILLDEMPA